MFAARSLAEYLGTFRGDDEFYIGRRVEVKGTGHTGTIIGKVGYSDWNVHFDGDYEDFPYYDEKLIPL